MATTTKQIKNGSARRRKKTETVHIGFLVDESGSMDPNRNSVVEGYNDFIAELADEQTQKDLRVTLAIFDSPGFTHSDEDILRVKFDGLPLREIRDLTIEDYSPRGATPLNDAVLETITAMDAKVHRGDKAMLVIMTDGCENSSRADVSGVRRMIEAREEAGWVFIYLGADQDAWAASEGMGLAKHGSSFSTTNSTVGTRSTMGTAAKAAKLYAAEGAAVYAGAMDRMSKLTGSVVPENQVLDAADYIEGKDAVVGDRPESSAQVGDVVPDHRLPVERSDDLTDALSKARSCLEDAE